MALFKSLFGDETKGILKRHDATVGRINALEETIEKLSNTGLAEQTEKFKGLLDEGKTVEDIIPEAFATVRETSRRLLGERHYDVQLIGGLILHDGNIAEMRTGEGKTLVGTLPVYVNALAGNGVHVVTVNDYLARRDAVWMGQIYSFLGLSVAVIGTQMSYMYDPKFSEGSIEDKERDETGSFKVQHEYLRPCTRTEAYEADITYGTNNEFGFDYLRDNIEYEEKNLRQRGHVFALVDEIDSILIDEARTPLIISAPGQESESLYTTFASVAARLDPETDYEVDEKQKAITLNDSGIERAEKLLGVGNIYTDAGIKYVHHLETAVRARALFEKDKQYVVKDNEIVIVDEFTGRLQPGRRWSEGLHQAIEAKEKVTIQKESRTFASVTFQNYFRMYDKLAGMTGTAETSSEEFYSVYNLQVVPVPTHRPVARIDHDDLIFQSEKGKFQAMSKKVRELHEKGQPVLIGTVSIEDNERVSEVLKRDNIPHELLNAKNHEREGEIVAQAGIKGKVTVATNMAGRGVDIKLGGAEASKEEREEIKSLGGLFVLGTERHDARRIDNQLRGRSGRQGDPGGTQFFVSLEDSLMRIFATDMVKGMMGRFNIPEDEPIQNKMITKALESAQKKIEGFNFDARKHVLSYDDVLNHQREALYKNRSRILHADNEEIDTILDEVIGDDAELKATIAVKKEELGDQFAASVRRLMLQSIDVLWVDHLEIMNYMRGSVNLRAYGQRDPLIEYRKEGLRLFRELEESIDEQTRRLLPNISSGAFVAEQSQDMKAVKEGAESITKSQTTVRTQKKIGRNEIVTITNGSSTKELKYKKAEELLAGGEWKLLS